MMAQTPAQLAAKARWRLKNPNYNADYYAKNAEHIRAKSRVQGRKKRGIVDATAEGRSGPCEICEKHCDSLCCDHDHSTGLVRGWLCESCNLGLGKLGDSAEAIKKVLDYLLR